MKPKRRNTHTKSRIVVIVIIVLAMLTVIAGTICIFLSNPEQQVKSKISALATDYYENYFYPNLTSSEKYSQIEDLPSAMAKYEKYGFSVVSLRQLLLYDNQKNSHLSSFLTDYCNENATYLKFYPEPPYSKTSYRVEYTYSCNF